jgi:hypothetical protein
VIYEYQTEDGRIVEHVQLLKDMTPLPESIPHPDDGAPAKRVWGAASVPSPKGWPMQPCVASGVQPEQAQELRDLFKKAGVPTEITKEGDPIYTSPEHRRRALKVRGLYDRSSYH